MQAAYTTPSTVCSTLQSTDTDTEQDKNQSEAA